MGLSGDTVWEVRTDGNDDNGGGYVSGGTDYSQQAAAQLTLTDLACAIASTTLTSATGGFTAAMFGNLIQIKSGTNFTTGWYHIIAYTDTNTVTIDRTACDGVGDASAGTGSVGGALATPGQLGKVLADHGVAGMKAWGKSGTYTLANSSSNVSGGVLSVTATGYLLEGYESSRGDLGAAPVYDAGAQTGVTLVTLVASGDSSIHFVNWVLDGNSGAGNNGLTESGTAAQVRLYKLTARDCPGYGFDIHCFGLQLKATGCGNGFQYGGPYACGIGCVADGNTVGFSLDTNGGVFVSPVAINNTGNGFDFGTSYGKTLICPTAYNNGADGIDMGSRQMQNVVGGVVTENLGYGINNPSTWNFLVQVAGYLNSSGFIKTATVRDYGQITLTGDPFIDAAGDDFRPDNTAGEGAALRGAGIGPVGQTNNVDIGAVQHADPAGGGGGSNYIIGA